MSVLTKEFATRMFSGVKASGACRLLTFILLCFASFASEDMVLCSEDLVGINYMERSAKKLRRICEKMGGKVYQERTPGDLGVGFRVKDLRGARLPDIADTPEVVSVSFSYCRFSPGQLAFLAKMPQLKVLHFDKCEIDLLPKDRLAIQSLEQVSNLRFRSCPFVDDELIAGLQCHGRLQHLEITRADITDTAIGSIAPAGTRIGTLVLVGCPITDRGCFAIGKMPQLRRLSLDDTNITDEGARCFASLAKLESLGISGTGVTDAGVEALVQLPSLKSLMLSQTRISNRAVRMLREKLDWTSLNLENTRIDDQCLDDLIALATRESLLNLGLGGTKLSLAALIEIRKSIGCTLVDGEIPGARKTSLRLPDKRSPFGL